MSKSAMLTVKPTPPCCPIPLRYLPHYTERKGTIKQAVTALSLLACLLIATGCRTKSGSSQLMNQEAQMKTLALPLNSQMRPTMSLWAEGYIWDKMISEDQQVNYHITASENHDDAVDLNMIVTGSPTDHDGLSPGTHLLAVCPSLSFYDSFRRDKLTISSSDEQLAKHHCLNTLNNGLSKITVSLHYIKPLVNGDQYLDLEVNIKAYDRSDDGSDESANATEEDDSTSSTPIFALRAVYPDLVDSKTKIPR